MTRWLLFFAFFLSIESFIPSSVQAAFTPSKRKFEVENKQGTVRGSPIPNPPQSTSEKKPIKTLQGGNPGRSPALSWDQQKKILARLKHYYDQGQWHEFQSLQRKLSRYSLKPILHAEMLYLSGLVNYQLGNFIQSLKDFDQGLGLMGPEGGSAYKAKVLFAKAKVYQKLNIEEQSRYFYTKIRREFPQTLEAARAEVELKYLR